MAISDLKWAQLKQRQSELGIAENELEIKAIHGVGKGVQKVNKTDN